METLEKRHLQYDRSSFTNEELVDIYKRILKPRLIEERMLILLRQGKITKWFSGWGQEAISVGTTYAMGKEEFILPMHRNLGVFTTRDVPLNRLFSQFQGKMNGFTKGRDRSFHFGSMEHHIVGMISHLGPQLSIADGIGLSSLLKKDNKTTLVFTGDGGASEGEFHEALNVAAVWNLPVIFAVENNQWGLSTPSEEQFKFKSFVDKGIGYGIDAYQIDGNNILEVISSVRQIATSLGERPRPFLLECMTFRMRGHEEASGTKYYPEGIQDEWELKDPVKNYELFLLEEGIITEKDVEDLRKEFKEEIIHAFSEANEEENIVADTEIELRDVFKEHQQVVIEPKSSQKTEKRLIDAVSDGLRQSMEKYPELVLMGQDIADYGGVFKVTEGFVDLFGKERVRNTPLCESAIVGAGLGLSIAGMKAMVEMQFADFVSVGFNQIVNNLAKLYWRWGQNADVVVRMPTGANTAAGPFHSQSNEAWFFHTPGLKIVYPAFPSDAKGLLTAAIEDPNPVLFFEHKYLYRSLKEEIYDDYYTTEIGKAKVLREGDEVTIVSYGLGVHWALEVVDEEGISADVIDLRTLVPMDMDTVLQSVRKTGRVIVLHEDVEIGGIGGEIVTQINEACFEYLDAPIRRVGSLNTPVPFNVNLERNFLPFDRFKKVLNELLNY